MVNSLDNLLKMLLIRVIPNFKKTVFLLSGLTPYKLTSFNFMVWITIALQLLFPLSIAFSPAIAATIKQQTIVATEPYVLRPGESVLSVANKYHLSLNELKTLNQFRSFSKPFDQLKVGDEIDIPLNVADLSADSSSSKTRDATPGALDKVSIFNEQTRGRDGRNPFDSNTVGAPTPADQNGDAAAMVKSAASGEISQTAQQWLSQFGTARVQLNVDDNFHLDGSALDLLIPLYDKPHELLFTQFGARNNDGRNTINIGAGARTWLGDWMYGMNAFYDEDVTAHNSRVGMGLEAWRNYLKLSANSYFRISDWRDSRDLEDYKERPANGYDIRAEAYLPAYPQLGGNLIFEQYRGDNVALFGKDNLQKDPYAVTLGVNYTPISLITLGVDYREGKSDVNDTVFNLQMNYRLGASWQSQISLDDVAATRTLAGTHYDLVERNNDIVLQYQKQQVIELRLPGHLSGHEGDSLTVTAQVTSKYALDHIKWDTSAIIAAAGKVTQVGQNILVITLPPYQRNGNATNIYTLSAVAYDVRNNASNGATTRIEVLPAAAQITAANLTVTKNDASANGSDLNEVSAKVTDTNGNPVAGQTVTFTATNQADIKTVIGTTGANGIATATLASLIAGISVVTATLNGVGRSVNTNFVADPATAKPVLSVIRTGAVANGIATNAVSAKVIDANGNILVGQTVTFTAANGTVTTVINPTGPDGIATATITSLVAGDSVVTATLSNGANQQKDTTFVTDLSTARIVLTVVHTGAVANGIATNEVSAKVTDVHSNILAGQTVTFTATNQATPTPVINPTGADGIATATLVSQVAGNSAVTATLSNGNGQTQDITFIADVGTARVVLTVVNTGALANGIATNAVSAHVTDAHGNILVGQIVTFTATNQATATPLINPTGPDGIATATLSSLVAGNSAVTATLSNGATQTKDINFVSDTASARIALTVARTGAVANGIATNEVSARVTDAHGNVLAGQTVTFTATNLGTVTPVINPTGADGIAAATLTSLVAGPSVVTATLSNGANQMETVTFIADTTSAHVVLTVVRTGAVANGIATNEVSARVTDAHGNILAGQTVTFTAGNQAAPTPVINPTGPDGIATATLVSQVAGNSAVTATLSNGANQSQNITFIADVSTAHVVLTVVNSGALANGIATNAVSAQVTDAHGNILAGQTVTFTATNQATPTPVINPTGADGIATATLTSLVAGPSAVTATLSNGNSQTQNINFVSDTTSARIVLTVVRTGAVANGLATNEVSARVTDANGNVLVGQTVTFTATNLGTVTPVINPTGPDGIATATLTSLVAGPSAVTATLSNGANQMVTVTFIADVSTAHVALTVVNTGALANGIATNEVSAQVTDAHGNVLAGQTVTFTATSQATPTPVINPTGPDGTATATLTSLVAGPSAVTATLSNGVNQTQNITFIVDISTAHVVLTVVNTGAVANGIATNAVSAQVTDAHGNVLAGQTVTFTASDGTVTPVINPTGADGIATATLVSNVAGLSTVTATLTNGNNQSVTVTFIADISTAHVVLTVVNSGALANGIATNEVSAHVTDAHSNVLVGQTVTFTAGNQAAPTPVINPTGPDGIAIATVVSQVAGDSTVTATLSNGANQSQNITFIADISTAHVVLTVVNSGALANGIATNAVSAQVTDAHGNVLVGQTLTFTASNHATVTPAINPTGADGIATATLVSNVAGISAVAATLTNANSQTQNVDFVADSASARIVLTVVNSGALANGIATNEVSAHVTDAGGNALAGQTVTFTATNLATATPVINPTGPDGIATATLVSQVAGNSAVTAALINGANQTVTVAFIADVSTAHVVLTVVNTGALANGIATNEVSAQVTDAHGNVLAGQTVTFTATNLATATAVINPTGPDGIATATLVSNVAGISAVTATLTNANNQTENVAFVGDPATAQVVLTVVRTGAVANGVDANAVSARVTDANGNVLAGQTVTFTATNQATVTPVINPTGTDGIATATLTSNILGSSTVTATLANNAFKTVDVTFGANEFLGSIVLTEDNATANGIETNVVRVTVVDAGGQPAANVAVTLTAANAVGTLHVVTPASTRTDAQGQIDIAFAYTRALGAPLTILAVLPGTGETKSASGGLFTIPTVSINVLADGEANLPFPAEAQATLITARGQPLDNTELRVTIMQQLGGGAFLIPFPPATAVSPVTTNGQGQATLSGTSTATGNELIFVLSAPGINEGLEAASTIQDNSATFAFF